MQTGTLCQGRGRRVWVSDWSAVRSCPVVVRPAWIRPEALRPGQAAGSIAWQQLRGTPGDRIDLGDAQRLLFPIGAAHHRQPIAGEWRQ